MSIDLDVLNGCSADDLQSHAEDMDGTWVAAAFIDLGERRIVVAVSTGADREQAIQDAMKTAISRVERAQAPS